MPTPLVVLVSGSPGSGKTRIVRELAAKLGLPLIAKDDVKESLGNSLGVGDDAWSKLLGAATWDLLFMLYERLLEGSVSFVAESNFAYVPHHEAFLELMARRPFVPFEVHCFADPATIAQRFRERQARRERHPVHHGGDFELQATPEAVAAVFEARGFSPLGLGPHLIRLDTGASDPVDLDGIVAEIRRVRDGL